MQEKKIGVPLKELAAFSRKAAAQGAVLLKNEGNMLPLAEGDEVAVFGRCQIDYYKSGTGSGGLVNVPYSTNLLDGLRAYPKIRLNEELIGIYETWIDAHPHDYGEKEFASDRWYQEEMPLTDEQVERAAQKSDKALVVIGRTAGEELDNADEPGSYRLTEAERHMISLVTKYFERTAILFNVANIVDMSWVGEEWCHGHVRALLYVWHGGMEGGMATADVLTGAEPPSGHLTDTIARSIKDYPAYPNYGNESVNLYEEDIYVGYRYFETFCPEKVLYPFGFGLTYTTFSYGVASASVEGEGAGLSVRVRATVKNTGAHAGREVLQLYAEAPQGRMGRPKRALAGFAKTGLLSPGEEETLEIAVDAYRLSSYDDAGVTGHRSCYVLEEGVYRFFLGEDCRAKLEVTQGGGALFSLDKTVVVQQLSEAAAPTRAFKRMKPSGPRDGVYDIVYEDVPVRTVDLRKKILENLPEPLPETGKKGLTLRDVKEGRATLEEFTATLTVPEMATMVRGEGMCNHRVTPGTAAAFGGVSDELAEKGIPAGCASDGPSGIRMDTGEKATQVPIGTLLACSFDTALMEELFYLEGQELVQNEVDTLLGPGINIHRFPLNGRNFEYYSEDPLVTGLMAAACERGLDRAGAMGTMKHFACNNQEQARQTVQAVVSERALREIYLKGFEIGVREGGARSIMTTYNPLNGYYNACNYELNTTILRGEWGYTGIVMTDWWASLDDVMEGGRRARADWWDGGLTGSGMKELTFKDVASMVRAQNDILMVVNNNGAVINAREDNVESAVAEGSLTVAELQRSAMNILRFLLRSKCSERALAVPKPARIAPADEGVAESVQAKSAGKLDLSGEINVKEGVWIRIEKDGLYAVNAHITSKKNDRTIIASTILLNGERAAGLRTNGPQERVFAQRLGRVFLERGVYELKVEDELPGAEFLKIFFVEEG